MRATRLTERDPRWVVNVGASGGRGVGFNCPEADGGCGGRHVIPFDRWKATGDTFETLTLDPSIKCGGACRWHGHIVNGAFTYCADSKSGPEWRACPRCGASIDDHHEDDPRSHACPGSE